MAENQTQSVKDAPLGYCGGCPNPASEYVNGFDEGFCKECAAIMRQGGKPIMTTREIAATIRCCYVENQAKYAGGGIEIDEADICKEPVAFEIWDGPRPDDYTQSCVKHLGLMVADEKESTVIPMRIHPMYGEYFSSLAHA